MSISESVTRNKPIVCDGSSALVIVPRRSLMKTNDVACRAPSGRAISRVKPASVAVNAMLDPSTETSCVPARPSRIVFVPDAFACTLAGAAFAIRVAGVTALAAVAVFIAGATVGATVGAGGVAGPACAINVDGADAAASATLAVPVIIAGGNCGAAARFGADGMAIATGLAGMSDRATLCIG